MRQSDIRSGFGDIIYTGPTRSWMGQEQSFVKGIIYLSPEDIRKAAVNIASLSTGAEETSELLEILGIDIKEVWP